MLLIHPLVLGHRAAGCSATAAQPARLRLVDSMPTTTGVIIATYQPDDRRSSLEARERRAA